MLLRVVLITLFLGSNLAFSASQTEPFSQPGQVRLLWLIGGTYVLTIGYALVYGRLRDYARFAGLQVLVDLALSALVVDLTGGTESVFVSLYPLIVLSTAVLLGRRAAMYALVVATTLIVLAVTREVTGWFRLDGPVPEPKVAAAYLTGITTISAVFLMAILAGYLSEQVRAAGQRLQHASADLEALRALNEHIVASIHSGLITYDLEGRVVVVNPAAARMLGQSAEAITGQPVRGVLGELPDPSGAVLDDRWEATVETTAGPRFLGFSRSPLFDRQDQHEGWTVIFQDLTQLRTLEQAVQRTERLAGIGQLAAGIAHEIRNPLASMSGSIEMMERAGDLDPVQRRLMTIVSREIERLNHLVSDFLRFARPSPADLRSVRLDQVLEETVAMLENRDRGDEVQVEVDVPPDTRVFADAGQLRQLVWNLVLNAVDASASGSVVHVCARAEPGLVRLTVRDAGCGMPAEVVDWIFDPFFTTKEKGTGLGLAQVHRMVEDHRGRLKVESTPGMGSTFEVTLPQEPT